MGNYATQANFEDRFSSDDEVAFLTDNTTAEGPNATVISEALEEAEGFINSYLARRYAVPVVVSSEASVAATLRGCTLDIAVYNVVGGRSDVVSDAKTKQYERWLAWLEAIAEGKVVLPGAATLPGPTAIANVAVWGSGDADVESDDATRVFSRESMATL